MSILAQRAKWETRRSLAFGSISGTYAALGTPLSHPVRMFKIVNGTDADISITDEVGNDKDIVLAGSSFIYDFTSNTTAIGGQLVFEKGKQIYIKGSPTSGTVYLVVIYGSTTGE